MLANVVKFVTRNKFQKDQDSIIKYIGDHTEDWFYFIVTRPGLTWEAPSKKRLSASRSVSVCTYIYACVYVCLCAVLGLIPNGDAPYYDNVNHAVWLCL
jgi:hypothetical protein